MSIARLNFLFSPETPNCLTTDEICSRFGVKKATVSSKASIIIDTLGIFHNDRRFCAPHITRLFEFYKDEHGFIHPATDLKPNEENTIGPIALKPTRQQGRTFGKGHKKTEKQPVKRDEMQRLLFPD
jgi:hypothetical protein